MQATGDALTTALIQARFDAWVATWPGLGTRFGLHQHDGRLPDLSRGAMLADIEAEAAFVRRLEAVDRTTLSERVAFERDLALHSARLRLFEAEVVRSWERTLNACDEIGDALFLLVARDFAPLAERLVPVTARIEAVPQALQQVRDRLGEAPVRPWMEQERDAASELPQLLAEILTGASSVWRAGSTDHRRLVAAVESAERALGDYARWIDSQVDRYAGRASLGADDLDRLIELRAFDGLSTDDILAVGLEQLEVQHGARREAGRMIDPTLDEAAAVELVKSDGPADFEAALEAYRAAMLRAREHIARHDLVTLPADDVLEVIPTPVFMRRMMPLAAYFDPATFDHPARGTYVVTPSVDGDAGAMREHNWSSIVNTSVHEAYPGHHLQLTAARAAPTPARLMVEAPEFVEGWGMYCEQMMLEQGFEDTPARRVIVATDAIWRAARIVLDIRLHRGEISVDDGVDFLVQHTGFERPVARAEVLRYTTAPGYNLSYLLGKNLLLRLRADEQARTGKEFSLKGFHDALIYSGSLPISYHRRLLAGEGGGPTPPPSPGA